MKDFPDIFFIRRIRAWYAEWERPISSLSLIGGFVFDALTLTRVDLFWENFWVVAHLLIVGIAIILINRQSISKGDENDPAKLHFWLLNILQFFFGGLLSTFLVFYFRSATLSVTWPFLLVLTIAFIANERLKRHYARVTFQVSLFFLCIFSFDIFLVPVVLHQIGLGVFLISDLFSLLLLLIFLSLLKKFTHEKFKKSKNILTLSIAGIFLGMNLLYFFNLIPPLPLSIKDAGVYHSITRTADGNYVVEDEGSANPFLTFFNVYQDINVVPGDPVFVYTAIFSPAAFNTDMVHEWQYYSSSTNTWITSVKVFLPVIGGRDGGYRTYSREYDLKPGLWRVNVETLGGAILGRIRFNIIATDTEPALTGEMKD